MKSKRDILLENHRPCVYRDEKICGENIFLLSKNLSLTKKLEWERLVVQKLDEIGIDRNCHDFILVSIEILLPVLVLTISALIFGFKK